jgi:cation transport ATPase
LNDDSHLRDAEEVELKESQNSDPPCPPESQVSEQKAASETSQESIEVKLRRAVEAREEANLSSRMDAHPWNSELDLSSRLFLLVAVAGTGAFGSWLFSTSNWTFSVAVLVIGIVAELGVVKLLGNRLDNLFEKNPVGMKLVVTACGIAIFLVVWILVRAVFAAIGISAEK